MYLWIFDLDGTLAFNQHRQHFLDVSPRKWKEWNEACVNDEPNFPLFHIMRTAPGTKLIMSGRDEAVRPQTEQWLRHAGVSQWRGVGPAPEGFYEQMYLRPTGDRTEDTELKKGWWQEHKHVMGRRYQHVVVFEDRKRMVDMWRGLGVQCWQVAPGEF